MFQQIKQLLKIEDVVEFYHEAPRHKKYICPFHQDKNPSLSIDRNKQIFKCFVCEIGGDLITFTAKLFGLSNLDACKKLNDDFRLNLISDKLSRKQQINNKRIQIKIDKRKKELEEAEIDYIYWIEQFATFDRLCLHNRPRKYDEVYFFTTLIEFKEYCWDKIKESEVQLWKLKNSQKLSY